MLSCSVVSDSLWPHQLQATRLLCPWDFPGKHTGVGCHSLLQGIFPTQGSNPGLLHCRQILYGLNHQGSIYPGHILWENHNWKRLMYLNVHSSTIYNRTWKQSRCPPTNEWIRKKMWYVYTVEYYSTKKRNEFESVLLRWMNLEPIIQSEVSQKEKSGYNILTHICGI